MKICHVITSLDIGGAELVLYRLLLAQPELKNDVMVISLTKVGRVGEQLQQAGFTVISLQAIGALSLISAVYKLAVIFKKNKPDIVQSWLYHADLVASLSAVLGRAPHVIWGIHTCQLPKRKPMTRLIMKSCALLSSVIPERIVCVAEAARQLHICNGYQAAKLTVIPNGFNLADYQSSTEYKSLCRKRLGIAENVLCVGVIGRWHPDKGQDIMLNAISLLQDRFPEVIFIFAGRGCDSSNEAFLSLVRHCPLPQNIIALGERSDITDILQALDVFCLPSRTEAFPLALGEAMCASLPVVATDVGDVRYMTGDLAPLVEKDNIEQLATGLVEMLACTVAERKSLGKKLQQRASTFFSIESMVENYQELYNRVSSGTM